MILYGCYLQVIANFLSHPCLPFECYGQGSNAANWFCRVLLGTFNSGEIVCSYGKMASFIGLGH